MPKIGTLLREARVNAGLIQDDVSTHFGKTKAWISEIENGRAAIYAHHLVEMAKLYEVPVEFFYSYAVPMKVRRPRSFIEWEMLYGGDKPRAQIHWDIDRQIDMIRAQEPTHSPSLSDEKQGQ